MIPKRIPVVLEIMRPVQWTKNFLLFAGLIFSGNLFHLKMGLKALLAFLLFCLLSGVVYIVNDLVDVEKDKKHPSKCKRPLPSGRLSLRAAKIEGGFLCILALCASFLLNPSFGFVASAYLLLNFGYTFGLKSIVLIDIISLALLFVLRAVAGCVVIGVQISPWLLLCTGLLALFVASGKRRHELLLLEKEALNHRAILGSYSAEFLDHIITATIAGTIVAYSLYTFSAHKSLYGMVTIPLAVYGIFRYAYLIYQKDAGGNPEVTLLEDRPLQITWLLWVGTIVIILYFLEKSL